MVNIALIAFTLPPFLIFFENRMLNDEQQAAVGMSLRAQDYLLIEGAVTQSIEF